jgi:major type 1 subunit fimbrin (pilin)
MKKCLLVMALCSPLSVLASNTITFVGEVSSSSCDVTVNGSSGDLFVQLPTVTTADLSAAGSTAGERDFTFEVKGCSGTTQTNVGVRLVAPNINSSGNLANLASVNSASQVAVQVLDGTSAIDFTSGEYFSAKKSMSSPQTFPFKARYISQGSATAGKVEAKLEYALSYN